MVKVLIIAGSEVDIQDDSGLSPLMIACRFGGLSIVKLLLENGANINAMMDNQVMCPLSLAIEHGNYEIGRLLIENEARIDVLFEDSKVIWDLFSNITSSDDTQEYKDEGSLYRKHWNLYHSHEHLHVPQYQPPTSPCSRFDDFWVSIKVEFKRNEERSLFEFMERTERERKLNALLCSELVGNLGIPNDVLHIIASPLSWC